MLRPTDMVISASGRAGADGSSPVDSLLVRSDTAETSKYIESVT